MAYRINYGNDGAERQKIQKRKYPLVWVALGVAAVALMIPEVRETLWHWILPGDGAVTAEALGDLVTDLKDGESFGNAVAVFCREIISHGG